jgi:hypothetical protein
MTEPPPGLPARGTGAPLLAMTARRAAASLRLRTMTASRGFPWLGKIPHLSSTHSHRHAQPLRLPPDFRRRQRQDRHLLFPAPTGKGRHRRHLPTAGVHPRGAGVRAAQLRRQEDHRAARAGTGRLAAQRESQRGDSLRGGAHPVAGLHRRAAAGRPGGHAFLRRPRRQGPEEGGAPGAGGTGGGPLGAGGRVRQPTCQCACSRTWKSSSSATGSATSS